MNRFRAFLLFFPESGLIRMPHVFHPAIGIFTAALALLILALHARYLSGTPGESTPPRQSHTIPRSALLMAIILAGIPPCFTFHRPPPPAGNFQVPSVAGHASLTRIPPSESETKFYSGFPGTVAIYQGNGCKRIIRNVTRATRKLHPTSHCLRAEGYTIGFRSIRTDPDGSRWLTYHATRNDKRYSVSERIIDYPGDPQWTEVSAWFWHAFLSPDRGPWQAVTLIERAGFPLEQNSHTALR